MCELLVGLPAVTVLAVDDRFGQPLRVHIETRGDRPCCRGCGGPVVVKDRPLVELVDLPCFGRPARLVWRKTRWACPSRTCLAGSWTEHAPAITAARLVMTDRAGGWVTEQVGRHGRTVNEVAVELGCDWHTVNDTVIAYGTALVDDPDRVGEVDAHGLDETLFCRRGRWRTQAWSTSIVDVRRGQLLDVVEGRNAAAPCAWLAARPNAWRDAIRWATLDLSGPYRKVFDTMLPAATQRQTPRCTGVGVRGVPCHPLVRDRRAR
jgi:transposase